MKKIFTDNLPKSGKRGINWKLCIDRKIYFVYENINSYFIIRKYDSEDTRHPSVLIEYNKNFKRMLVDNIRYFQFIPTQEKNIIDKPVKYKYSIDEVIDDDNRHIKILNRYIKFILSKNNQTSRYKFYDCECLNCGFKNIGVREYDILKGNGCPACGNIPKIVAQGINDIPTTDPWMIPYFQGGYDEAKKYNKTSHKKIDPICPDCGTQLHKKIPISSIYTCGKISCPKCQDGISFPNKVIFNTFLQIEEQIDFFEREFAPNWCKFKFKNKVRRGLYDLYFEKNGCKFIVEMDGSLGHGIKGTKYLTKEESKIIDSIKDELAKQNNIKMIRIDCTNTDMDYIKKNMLNSELCNIVDLNYVNWDEVRTTSEKNFAKLICEEYKNGLSYNSILKKYKISSPTLTRYLKIGNECKWINYDGILQRNKSIRKKFANPVSQFDKKHKFIKTFCSQCEAQRITGISSSTIGECCKGKRKTAGGFIWRYADDVKNNTLEVV